MKGPLDRRPAGGFWRQVILNLGALLGAFCILATVAATMFGITPLVFRSGSMAPAIATGALALSHTVSADRVHVGDVVSVVNQDGTRITHRVAGIRRDGSTASLTLKGDANQAADLQPYRVTSVKRVLFSVPRLGYFVAAASTRAGVFVGVAFVVLVLFLGFSGPLGDSEEGSAEGARERLSLGGRGGLVVVAVAALAAGAIAVPLVPTMAFFTATATLSAPIAAARTFPPAPTLRCTASKRIVTMTWTAYPGAAGYTLHYGSGGNTTTSVPATTLTQSFNSVGQSGTFSVDPTFAVGTSPVSNAETYTVGNGNGNTTCTDAP